MNVEEKVATLEALLARVQNNAAKPRIPRPVGAAPPNGGAHLAAPEPTVAAPTAPATKPVEKLAPARAEAAPAQDSIDAQLAKLLDVKVEKPVEAKVQKPVEAKADPIDVWAEALQDEVPAVQPASPIVAPKVDEGTPKPAPIAARSVTPVAAKPVAARPVAPVARPVVPRSTFGSKAEVTPSPAPTAAKVPETAKVVEKIEPAITPPKPVEKVAPIVAAPKPAEKITPIVAASKPADKVEKIDGIKAAEDEIRFDFDLAPPKKPETKAAEKPVETAVAAKPEKAPPPLPVTPSEAGLAEEDDPVTRDEETMLMHGSIPEPEAPVIADETTSDEETVVSLPKTNPIAAKADVDLSDDEPTTDAIDEPTQIFQGRPSSPEAESPARAKGEDVSAPKVDDLKVVVSPAVRASIADAHETSTTDETERSIRITEAVPAPRASDSAEATSPSRHYSKPDSEELEPLPMNGGKRPSTLMLGLVAAALIGAGVFLGLRNGWFEGSSPHGVPTAPTASGPAPTASTAAITTASAAPIAPTTSAATPEPTTSAGVAPTTTASASAAPLASAAPSVTASSAPSAVPTAAPVVDGDGTNLPPNRGYVIINSTKPAHVFLTGNFAGAAGAKLEVECGAKFLRLSAPWPAGAERPATPDWTSEGRSISVACRSTTTIALEATR